jgi:hypothetical protein
VNSVKRRRKTNDEGRRLPAKPSAFSRRWRVVLAPQLDLKCASDERHPLPAGEVGVRASARTQTSSGRTIPALALAPLLVLLASLALPVPARTQAGITVLDAPAPAVVFGEVILFDLSAQSTDDINAISLFLQAGQEEAFAWREVAFEPGAVVDARATVDLATAALPPFSPVAYWWEITTQGGGHLTTEPATFFYEDDRLPGSASPAVP